MNIDSRDLSTADLLPTDERRTFADSGPDAGPGTDADGLDLTDAPSPAPSWTDRDEGEDTDLLFGPDDSADFERRWTDVQTRFVDDPREAVQSADNLVAEVMQSLARRFADHKATLEDQWSGGGDVETEELRQALRRYRAFFHRLLAA